MKSFSLAGPLSLAVLLLLPLRLPGQTGDLRVVVATSGSRIETDGYVVALDTLRQSVGVVGSVVFTQIKPGIHTAILLDVAEGCIVPEGNSQKVVVRRVGVAELRFDVVCGESVPDPPAPREPAEPPAPREPVEPPERRDEPQEDRLPTPGALSMGSFSVGQWVATIEPPGFPSYPVNMTLDSEQSLGELVGSATYEAPSWSCSYDLILESVGNDNLVVAQELIRGDCPDGIRVVLTRLGADLGAEWLRADEGPWFEAVFVRSQ